ncbi:Hypothetical_protein [Hexamita inflata]|uniref:Hypothetical_protein n=1 Tax=Hexamita inflata TaxID=28002 RepID=A0ABP1ISX4_9EUKA
MTEYYKTLEECKSKCELGFQCVEDKIQQGGYQTTVYKCVEYEAPSNQSYTIIYVMVPVAVVSLIILVSLLVYFKKRVKTANALQSKAAAFVINPDLNSGEFDDFQEIQLDDIPQFMPDPLPRLSPLGQQESIKTIKESASPAKTVADFPAGIYLKIFSHEKSVKNAQILFVLKQFKEVPELIFQKQRGQGVILLFPTPKECNQFGRQFLQQQKDLKVTKPKNQNELVEDGTDLRAYVLVQKK